MTRGGGLHQASLACRIAKVSAKDGKDWSKLKPRCPLPGSHRMHKALAGITDIKAIRWASDRIGDEGIIAFISNNSFVDEFSLDGVRKHLSRDFNSIS